MLCRSEEFQKVQYDPPTVKHKRVRFRSFFPTFFMLLELTSSQNYRQNSEFRCFHASVPILWQEMWGEY